MVVACPSCGKKYKVTEQHFGGKARISIRCPNCGKSIDVVQEEAAPQPPALKETHPPDDTGDGYQGPDMESLAMPEGKRVSLAILQGRDAGNIFPIAKPLVIIGRTDTDLVLNDSEVSRQHAQIELRGNSVLLRDLKSTNGTYVNEQRVTCQPVENQTEFRIGATTLMLILTDDEN